MSWQKNKLIAPPIGPTPAGIQPNMINYGPGTADSCSKLGHSSLARAVAPPKAELAHFLSNLVGEQPSKWTGL